MGAPLFGQFVPSAARTTSGSQRLSPGVGDYDRVAIYVNVTAASGTTPTLDLVLEDSPDGGATWFPVATAPQITATGLRAIRTDLSMHGDLRLSWAIGGTTPSFTFTANFSAQRNGT
jgi:hypothetical protein